MGEKENRAFGARKYLEMAQITLLEYKTLRDNNLLRGGMSRLYFAAYQAVYASLLSIGETPKTHKGTANLFFQHFVSKKLVSREVNTGFSKLQMYRGWSDYEYSHSFSDEELDEGFEVVTQILAFAEEWLKRNN